MAGVGRRAEDDARAAQEREFLAQYRRDHVAMVLRDMGAPPRADGWTLDNCPAREDPQGAAAWRAVSAWVEGYTSLRELPWLVLTGGFGNCKTSLAIGAARALAERAGEDIDAVRFVVASELFLELQEAMQTHTDVAVVRRYQQASLLVLDDVGADYETAWTQSKFFAILNERYDKYRPTIITSNLSGNALKEHLTERVMWRVLERAGKRGRVLVKGANLHDPLARATGRGRLRTVNE